jgi:simple sugar transport system permease protein
MSELLAMLVAPELLAALPRFVAPVLLAALGGALCERSGVVNIALEGMLLAGAFAAVCGSYASGNAWIGVALAMLTGLAIGALFAWLHVRRGGDAIVVAIGLNLLVAGGTVFLLRVLFQRQGVLDDARIAGIAPMHLPLLDALPLLGRLFEGQSPLFLLALLLTLALHLLLARHRFGLHLRAAGEHPQALAASGVSPQRVRTAALLACGALCALAGAQLSLSNVTLFVENMSAGRGWIALVLVLLSAGRPMMLLVFALLFALINQLGVSGQALGWPQQLSDALPYVVTLLALAWVSRRRLRMPRLR